MSKAVNYEGTIFSIRDISNGKTSYFFAEKMYPNADRVAVRRCSKTGKLYKDYNSYETKFFANLIQEKKIEIRYNVFELVRLPGNYDVVKAKLSPVTRTKNRIHFLRSKIEKYARELEELESSLVQ